MNHTPIFMTVAGLALTAMAACSSTAPSTAASSRPAAKRDKIRALHDYMQEHFVRTDLMQKALIAGDLARVRQEAKWLVEQPEAAGMPGTWTPFVLELMQAAADITKTTEPAALALGVGRMGAACGNCHNSLGLRVALTWPEPPRENTDPRIHMLRHQWAVARFWDGLISASNRPWAAGARAFEEEELHSDELTADEKLDPHVQALEASLHDIGKEASGAVEPRERVRVFAKVLSTCARCHNEMGRGPASVAPMK